MNDSTIFKYKGEPPVKETTNLTSNNLASPINTLISQFRTELEAQKKKEISPINVDEVASKFAKLYERIRKVVDWKEENVLRRSATFRILKRSLISKISIINFVPRFDITQVSESLIRELIRGGHLPNDEVPSSKIGEVAIILKKYIHILEFAPFVERNKKNPKFLLKEKVNFYNWILEVAAAEIEESLAPPIIENALIKGMTLTINPRIRILAKNYLDEKQKSTLTYIAVCRTLYDLDDSVITYHILKYHYQDWTAPDQQQLDKLAKNIFIIKENVNNFLQHPLSHQFFNICENSDTVFTLLGDVINKYKNEPDKLTEIFADKKKFNELIKHFYSVRYKTLKTRLFRMALVSTLSVLVANIITYFEIELPIAYLIKERFSTFATIFDFLVPCTFMFFLVSLIRPPSEANLKNVLDITNRFVYKDTAMDIFEIKLKKKRRSLTQIIIDSIYISACLLMFYAIGSAFHWAGIPMSSVILDTSTIGLNIFAALVIRNKSRELTVREKNSMFEFIIDIFTTPVAEVGAFFANKWREYNIISVFFNFFFEVPLVIFVEFIEDWRHFLSEKKADIH